jgi:uncharacterized protein YdeI (YjbR/CyaY-like superfamily)
MRHPMPSFIEEALTERGLKGAYSSRPPYQQNDYIGWIMTAKRKATQEKRLAQMLDEVARGDGYMNMTWKPRSAKNK